MPQVVLDALITTRQFKRQLFIFIYSVFLCIPAMLRPFWDSLAKNRFLIKAVPEWYVRPKMNLKA
jgi:hypothetical protein